MVKWFWRLLIYEFIGLVWLNVDELRTRQKRIPSYPTSYFNSVDESDVTKEAMMK